MNDDNDADRDGHGSLRADAALNRRRILEAAREVFAEQGIGASTNEIARHAGVGVATLFRRFPTRDDLIAAAFTDKMDRYSQAISLALTEPDPWKGFCDFIEEICTMQAEDRGFADVLTMTFAPAKAFRQESDRAAKALTELIQRAKDAGRLRADFAHQDVPLFLIANAGVVNATRAHAPDSWRRLVGYLLQSLAAEAARPLPKPPTPRSLYRALMTLS